MKNFINLKNNKSFLKNIFFIFLFNSILTNNLEINLLISNETYIPIFNSKNNNLYSNSLFNYDDNAILNSFSSDCSFNRIFVETNENNETLFEIIYLITSDLEKNINFKQGKFEENEISNDNPIQNYYFLIKNITNNLDTIQGSYSLTEEETREYLFNFDNSINQIYLQGKLILKYFYFFRNFIRK